MRPKVTHVAGSQPKSYLVPSQIYLLGGFSEVECRDIVFTQACSIRHPHANIPSIQRLMSAVTVLIDLQNFLIGDQFRRRGVVAWQVAAKH